MLCEGKKWSGKKLVKSLKTRKLNKDGERDGEIRIRSQDRGKNMYLPTYHLSLESVVSS